MFLSAVADRRRFQHSLKALIVTSLVSCLLAIVWFELSVSTYFYETPILPSTAATIGLSTAIIGLFSGGALPLIYEALAEIMFPLPESLSASILVEWSNVATLIFLSIAPNRSKLMNILVLAAAIICICMIVLARFSYRRRDEDERRRLKTEQEKLPGDNNNKLQINGINNEQQYGTSA